MARIHPSWSESASTSAEYRTLWNQIRRCELLPGQVITAHQAAAQLNIGLLPARNALVRLAQDGLVQPVPRRGYRVTPLTQKSVDDFFLTWRLIAPEIARRGLLDASHEQVRLLHRLLMKFESLPDLPPQNRSICFVEYAEAMFHVLAVATTNGRLLETYRCMLGEMARIWSLVLADAAGPKALIAAHPGWCAAIGNRDGDRAADVVHCFLDLTHAPARRLARTTESVP
ncbi:DNA-binding transcriptional regulator, GntR family [Prauserella aidingensis]|uniref:GntR family transcriptional regulator n=1 Tax=Prauserella aidingensis TaxID=387890 RepID=UPI0026463A8B|nr:GntR family transcriptional regulator [Prauserella aidingensis]MCP2256304.1 DNA-binding transcriptional regulator, GntR family [Prauserella aidingensis]